MKSASPKFFQACRTGRAEVVAKLLDAGVDPNARDKYQLTGLIYAARKGRLEVGKLFLESGADLEAADLTGRTALVHAVAFYQYEFVEWLAECGANVNVIDSHDCTPLDLARCPRDKKMEALLEQFGAAGNSVDAPDDSVTEMLVGLDELNWFGILTLPLVMPLRKLLDKHCKEKYCEEFESINFELHIEADGPKTRCGRVGLGKRASYIGIDIVIDGQQDNLPSAIATQMREATRKIVEKMQRTDIPFKSEEFARDMASALDEYERVHSS